MAGELVTDTVDHDGGRQVTAYLPPGRPEAVVFAGDGQGIARWISTLEAATMPPTMVIGVHSAADEGVRLHEYSPGFDPQRFAGHERLFVARVREWARGRFGVALPPSRTAVHGVSAGGELAIALGLRHPDVYGVVLSASPGAGCPTVGHAVGPGRLGRGEGPAHTRWTQPAIGSRRPDWADRGPPFDGTG